MQNNMCYNSNRKESQRDKETEFLERDLHDGFYVDKWVFNNLKEDVFKSLREG